MQFDTEGIRKRPAMFVGCTGQTGVYNLIFMLAEEFIHDADKSNVFMDITINDDNSLVFICDRPIDTDTNYNLAVLRALSDIFELSFTNEDHSSVRVLFRPDKEVFSYEGIDYYRLYNRFKELSQLNENVRFLLTDSVNRNLIQYQNGLNEILYENMPCYYLQNSYPTNISFSEDNVEVSLSMVMGYPADATISYVNNSKVYGGGSHIQGLYDGVYYAFKKYIKRFGDEISKVSKKEMINDLNFVISIRVENPRHEGSWKRALSDDRVRLAVRNGIVKYLEKLLESDQQVFNSSSAVRRAAFMYVVKSSLKKIHPDTNWDD